MTREWIEQGPDLFSPGILSSRRGRLKGDFVSSSTDRNRDRHSISLSHGVIRNYD